jgi:3-dehydroquinate synthase
MLNSFKIENKILFLNHEEIQSSQFLIKSKPYDYIVKFINHKTLKSILLKSKNLNKEKSFLFIDKNVNKIYKEELWEHEHTLTLLANEKNKTITSSLLLIDKLNENNFTKKEVLISIGGGITQDVTAFARSIFKRGINWTYFPTTLLSMADSCIGAKSAINYGGTKNLIGLFSAPKEVYINTAFLQTLETRDILSGYGEILKLCIVGGDFAIEKFTKVKNLQNGDLLMQIDVLIKTALIVKKAVITEDEYENNIRKALNYGHTIAHAIEPIVEFKIPHGVAVLIGMFVENHISKDYGFLDFKSCNSLNKLIYDYIDSKSINILKSVSINELLLHMKKDKKNELNNISFAVPIAVGNFKILQLKNDKKLLTAIKKAFKNLLLHHD